MPATPLNTPLYLNVPATLPPLPTLRLQTGLRPKDIDILVTTCSVYCPTPSMASMVVNAFGMRKDVQAYHLGGMGCANGVVGINMVADLLKVSVRVCVCVCVCLCACVRCMLFASVAACRGRVRFGAVLGLGRCLERDGGARVPGHRAASCS